MHLTIDQNCSVCVILLVFILDFPCFLFLNLSDFLSNYLSQTCCIYTGGHSKINSKLVMYL